MRRIKGFPLLWVVLSSIIVFFIIAQKFRKGNHILHYDFPCLYNSSKDFELFDNVSGTRDGCYIVPNIVHFVRFGKSEFSFEEAICVIAAAKNQKPEAIFFHMDVPKFQGKYWEVILSSPYMAEVNVVYKYWKCLPGITTSVILRKYGGIYLDNLSYVVKSLDEFRRFEMVVGWEIGGNVSNQVIIANKYARFLRKLASTHDLDCDCYEEVLSRQPELVHRVTRRLGEQDVIDLLYLDDNDKVLRDHYTVHLSPEATHPVVLNEENIANYQSNFQSLVNDVYPFKREGS